MDIYLVSRDVHDSQSAPESAALSNPKTNKKVYLDDIGLILAKADDQHRISLIRQGDGSCLQCEIDTVFHKQYLYIFVIVILCISE